MIYLILRENEKKEKRKNLPLRYVICNEIIHIQSLQLTQQIFLGDSSDLIFRLNMKQNNVNSRSKSVNNKLNYSCYNLTQINSLLWLQVSSFFSRAKSLKYLPTINKYCCYSLIYASLLFLKLPTQLEPQKQVKKLAKNMFVLERKILTI